MVNLSLRRAAGAVLILSLFLVTGCSANDSAAAATTDTSSNTSVTVVAPAAPPPPPSVAVVAASTAGEADIADNFDTNTQLQAWEEVPAQEPDPVGAFRFTCNAGQLAKDDPIVYPGQPGKSHLHQFFGNTGTNANSNYNSLRTTGGSTCTRSATESPQRSAYWMPAMLDGAGNAVKP